MTEKSFFVNATNSVRQDDEKIEESFGEQGSSNWVSKELDKLSKMRIIDMEFDEFVKLYLYFIICSSYPEYLSEVWPNVIKIKKAIMHPSSLQKDVTCKSHYIIN